jgi:hypothetical protein
MQKNLTTKFLVALGFPLLLLILPLVLLSTWLPDIFFSNASNANVLASKKLASGDTFKVVQYWNNADFYNTELHHILPNGQLKVTVLDGDDYKTWWTPMSINEKKRQVMVTLVNNRIKTLNW